MRVLICESCPVYARHLQIILHSFGYEIIGIANNKTNAIKLINSSLPDIALIDIKLQTTFEGIRIARFINKNHSFPFIFTTDIEDKAIVKKALEENPAGYILKPFKAIEIYSAIQIALGRICNLRKEASLFVKEGNTQIKIFINQIRWIKSENIYLNINTLLKTYTIRQPLAKFKKILPEDNFVQCHRSFIVNTTFIDKIHNNSITIDGVEIPISRKFQYQLKDKINTPIFNQSK